MTIDSVDDLIASYATGQRILFNKAATAQATGQWASFWGIAGQPGTGTLTIGNTSPGAVPTDATAGAPTINAFGSGNTGYLASGSVYSSVNGQYFLADRLYHAGSFSLALGAVGITDPPSFSSRLPNGDYTGVSMWLEIATVNGATNTTVTVSYTNEKLVSGRTAALDANINAHAINRLLPFRLQAGDLGVSSIQSVTVGGVAGTGTVNVVLSRLIAAFNVYSYAAEPRADIFKLGMPIVYDTSCLWMYALTGASSPAPVADFVIVNG